MRLRNHCAPIATAAALAAAAIATPALAEPVLGLTADNRLVTFDSSTPGTVNILGPIAGLQAGENLVGLDWRPLTGQIAAVGSSSRVYFLNLGTLTAIPVGSGFSPPLTGTDFGIDFNPTVDRIRVVSTSGENRRLNPLDGSAVAPGLDTPLSYAGGGGTPRAVGAAYTNSLAGGVPAGTVRQFIIDSNLDILGEVGSMAGGNASFNGGIVTQIGALGFNTSDYVGFDIAGASGLALASLSNPNNLSSLYTINLNSGAATLVGGIGSGAAPLSIRDITILPAPSSAGLLALASLGLARRRR